MAITPHGESAKIFKFPLKPRPTATASRDRVNLAPDIGPRIATAAFDSWYHEEALADSDPNRKQ
jgi:hypothetical protein